MVINNMTKNSKLISEGAFGCIYYPGINCKGVVNAKENNVSKLQVRNFYSENEIKISKIIREIDNYNYYFLPVTKYCPVNLKTLKNNVSLSECSIIEDVDNKTKNKYLLMEIPYISNISFYSLLTSASFSKKHILLKLIETYEHLLDALDLLGQKKIVHNDLKGDNILYNVNNSVPQIIDFGISISFDLLNNENIKDYFYVYAPEYNAWSLDYDVICYLLHEMPSEFDETIIEKICNDYVNNQKFWMLVDIKTKETYLKDCIKYYKSFIGKSKNTILNSLLKHYKTWDNYGLSILYLTCFSHIFTKELVENNKLLAYFSQILFNNISPDPNKRYNIEETKRLFKNIFYLEDNVNIFIDFIEDLDYDVNEITKKISQTISKTPSPRDK